MKSFFLITLLFLFSFSSFSQVQQGDKILGGQVSINYTSINTRPAVSSPVLTDRVISFQLAPSFGYMLSDKWALGGNLIYGYTNHNQENFNFANERVSTSKIIDQNMGIGLFAQRYFGLAESLYFRTQGAANYIYGKSNYESERGSSSETSRQQVRLHFSPGFNYFLNDEIALSLDWRALSYSYSSANSNQKVNYSFDINFNISSLSYGLEWYF